MWAYEKTSIKILVGYNKQQASYKGPGGGGGGKGGSKHPLKALDFVAIRVFPRLSPSLYKLLHLILNDA